VTAATPAMGAVAKPGRLSLWCGWMMVGAAALVVPITYLAQLGFAPLMALLGLLCLPAFRVTERDRPVQIVLAGLLIWAAVSTLWSPWRPKDLGANGALQLGLALPLYWSAICGARRADPRLNRLALDILTWSIGGLGVILLIESATGAGLYLRLHQAAMGPIRIDLAQGNVARAVFSVAVLWPAILVGGLRRGWPALRLALVVVGETLAAVLFKADAPILALPVCVLVMLGVWLWPTLGPRLMAAAVAALTLVTPALVWAVRANTDYDGIERGLEISFRARMSYWSHAADAILQQPWRGWGFDASRAMKTGMQLHPHNQSLQLWLELGVVGAVAAAAFWSLSLIRLSRPTSDLAMTGVAGSVAVYLVFGWLNYGVWQGWWVALGALIPVLAAMRSNSAIRSKST